MSATSLYRSLLKEAAKFSTVNYRYGMHSVSFLFLFLPLFFFSLHFRVSQQRYSIGRKSYAPQRCVSKHLFIHRTHISIQLPGRAFLFLCSGKDLNKKRKFACPLLALYHPLMHFSPQNLPQSALQLMPALEVAGNTSVACFPRSHYLSLFFCTLYHATHTHTHPTDECLFCLISGSFRVQDVCST